jgi:aspartyl-tRNA(Asn)/glutamyl-tRNA(Gln) amidotransferase subunit C
MMKITDKDVSYVADLANLELTENERTRMQKDLDSIIGYIDMLNELDTSNVEPLTQISGVYATTGEESKSGSGKFAYALRPDVVVPGLSREDALRNAPETDGVLFKVPKVIEK